MQKNNRFTIFMISGALILVAAFMIKELYPTFYYVLLVAGAVVLLDGLLGFLLAKNAKGRADGSTYPTDQPKTPPEYRRKKSMLTAVEKKFYYTLQELFGDKYDILYQVPLNNVIDKLTQNSYRNELFRVADFCLVSKGDFSPLLLIELNDSSHNRADRIERDKKVGEICAYANMPIIAIKTSEMSDYAFIRKQVKSNILKK